MADVDVGDPRADLDAPGGRAHELGGGHDIVVHFGGKDGVEARFFGLARDALDFTGAPANTGDDRESESIGHESLLSGAREPLVAQFVSTPKSATNSEAHRERALSEIGPAPLSRRPAIGRPRRG